MVKLTKPKHIAFLQRHLDSGNGGEERSLFSILTYLSRKEDVKLSLFFHKIGDFNSKLSPTINQYPILPTELTLKNCVEFLYSILQAYRIIVATEITHIHVNHYKDITWAALLKKIINLKLTVHLRLNAPEYLSRQYAWGLQQADRYAANSEFVKRDWSSYIPAEKIEVIYNGVDINPNEIDETSTDIDILFVGRLVQEKGLHLAIKALADLPMNRKLCVIGNFKHSSERGEQHYEEEIHTLIQKHDLHDRVQFLGQLENPYPYIKKATCVVVPSYHDSFGRTFMEAWTLGTPAIASYCGGMLELVEKWPELREYLFEEGDWEGLGKILNKLNTKRKDTFIQKFDSKNLIELLLIFWSR